MSTFATAVGLAAAVCTTGANLPQLKKAWTTGQTDDISMNMLLVLATGLALWVAYGVLKEDQAGPGLGISRDWPPAAIGILGGKIN